MFKSGSLQQNNLIQHFWFHILVSSTGTKSGNYEDETSSKSSDLSTFNHSNSSINIVVPNELPQSSEPLLLSRDTTSSEFKEPSISLGFNASLQPTSNESETQDPIITPESTLAQPCSDVVSSESNFNEKIRIAVDSENCTVLQKNQNLRKINIFEDENQAKGEYFKYNLLLNPKISCENLQLSPR